MDMCKILDWVVSRAGKTIEESCDLGLIPVSRDIFKKNFLRGKNNFVEYPLLTWYCS